jgi:Arc/MetJ family transcription regulator
LGQGTGKKRGKELTIWHQYHILDGMKMTMHIDDGLLERVMAATGATSKTMAVDLALREMDRRAKLMKMCAEGLGLTADELHDAVDPAYDLEAMRRSDTPVRYARKARSR